MSASRSKTRRKGELVVRFAGKAHEVRFSTDGQVFSADVLRALNAVIAPSGYRFIFVCNDYCTGFVTLLSREEEALVIHRRKWKLDDLSRFASLSE